ncbi:MAG: cell division protein FtsW (lipid II flippase) [Marinoscillum sp.]|jgi:cell division protein FtsW (lipid II flippase)
MKIRVTFFLLTILSCFMLLAQTVEDVTTPQEAPLSSRIILYAMTGLGVLLLFMSFKRSKWGKKS